MNVKLFPKGKSRQLIVVLVMILLLLPISFLSLGEASETVKQEIHDFARGSYDILLRPPDSRSEIEQRLGLVEENYLGIGTGGITRSQWENVLAREDVEIAAPVAAIGLFKPSQITYALPPRPDEALRYNVTHFTFDGVNTYTLNKYTHYTLPDNNSWGCVDIAPENLVNLFWCDMPMYYFPDAYHQVVAIDVDQEALLTGNNYSIIRDAVPSLYERDIDNFLDVPIISLKDSRTPLTATLEIEAIDFTQEDTIQLKEKYGIDRNDPYAVFHSLIWNNLKLHNELMEEMKEKPALFSEIYELDFSEKVVPFYDNYLYTDENYQFYTYEEQMISDFNGQISSFSQKQFYFLHPVEYQWEENNVSIRQVDVDETSGVPIYRKMDNVQSYVFDDGEITDGFGFSFKHAGYFDVELEEDVLAAAPLGIYGLQKTHLKDDPEKSIHPTSIPGSFLSTPAHGLISLEWAEELKGEAPIDAIRVRVAGIDGYNEQASAKIKALAAEFEADGFTVDIVAGASHQSLTMDVEGLGTVVQPWTTLGAADTILHSWNLVRIVLVILFTLVCLIYTLSRLIYLQKARQPEEEQLRHFGWGEREIVQIRRQEWRRLIGYPFAISFLVLLAYASYTGIWELLAYSGMLLVVLLVLVFVSIFVTEKQAPHRTIPAVKGPLPFQNAWYYRNIVLAAILQLAITTFISVFLTLFLQQEQARTTLTTLGIYVHGEMEWYYVILLALLYTLTALTVVETLAELWKKREKEISLLKQIGWGTSKLSLFYLKEVAVWNGISVVGAALVAIGSFAYLTGDVLGQLPIVFALSAAVYLAFLLAAWLVFRIVERALRMA